MKTLMLAVLAIVACLAPAPVHATTHTQDMTLVAKSSGTCYSVAVTTPGASAGLTDFSLPAPPSGSWASIVIRNMEASNAVWSNESQSVSTTTTSALISGAWVQGIRGDKVAAASLSQEYHLTPGQHWYGVCDKTSGTCDVEVCKHD